MKEKILSLQNIKKDFVVSRSILGRPTQTVKALHDVSLDVYKGEVLGIVGESGCGKSTLGRMMLRLIRPTSGQIFFENQNITDFSQRKMRPIRKHMQMVFQDPYSSLNPRLNVQTTLAEPLIVHHLAKKNQVRDEVVRLLELVGLKASDLQKYPHEFSGGQRQRIGIARALAVNPKLIVADEAVSALDLSVQAQVVNLLMELKEKLGLTLVFISHDLKIIKHVSDRICVMYLGRVMELFDTRQHISRHPYTKALFESVPTVDLTGQHRPLVLKGEIPSPLNPPSGCVFHTRCPMSVEKCKVNVSATRDWADGQIVTCDLI